MSASQRQRRGQVIFVILATLILVLPPPVAKAQDNSSQAYRDIVALEYAAERAQAQGQSDDARLQRKRAIESAKEIKHPRLVAVLLTRWGNMLDRNNQTQDAVLAYEAALYSLAERELGLTEFMTRQGQIDGRIEPGRSPTSAGDATSSLAETLKRLGAVSKGFTPGNVPIPTDVYSPRVAAVVFITNVKCERNPL